MDLDEDTSLILLDLSAALDILSIIPSFSLVYKIDSALMVFVLIGSHLISLLAIKQSQSMIPHSISAFSTLSCGVLHSFSFSKQILLALWSKEIHQISFVRWYADETQLYNMCTSLSSFTSTNSALFLESTPLSLTFSPGWTWTNSFFSHPKVNFFLIGLEIITTRIFWSNKLLSQQLYHPSQFFCSQSWMLHLWHVFLWSNQLCWGHPVCNHWLKHHRWWA